MYVTRKCSEKKKQLEMEFAIVPEKRRPDQQEMCIKHIYE